MNDYFALFQEARRPWLDAEALKAKFLVLSTEAHPDRVHHASEAEKQAAHQRYTELMAAYQCLREPKDRLAHLLELERGNKPGGIERVPAETMELFTQVAQLCRDTDGFLAKRARISSPLLKVQMFERAMDYTAKLNHLRQALEAQRAQWETSLKAMTAAWESAPAIGSAERVSHLPLDELEQVYRSLSYLARWTGQLQERIVQLSL